VGGEAADDELASVLLDELLRPLGADRGLELVVAKEHLDLLAEDPALRVQHVDGEESPTLLVGREGAEGTGDRPGEPDADRAGWARMMAGNPRVAAAAPWRPWRGTNGDP